MIPTDRVIKKLDELLYKNDYDGAKRHLLYWKNEAKSCSDDKVYLLIQNELMGLYRKLGEKEEAIECVQSALEKITQMGVGAQTGAATTYLNCATVYKAFGMADC